MLSARRLCCLIVAVVDVLAPVSGRAQDIPDLRSFGDRQLYTRGPYSAWMDPFNKKDYVPGRDFNESLTVQPSKFPSSTTLNWSWPIRTPRTILGFLQAAAYGDYFGTVPQTPIRPTRVDDITRLLVSHDLTFSGTADGYDIIYDYFLTETPHGSKSRLFEIEVFLHSPPYSIRYFNEVTAIGLFTGSGVTWTVGIDRRGKLPDILFMPANRADVPVGTIDLDGMHVFLKAQGILTGNEYYNGHSLGVEPAQGVGTLFVNSASVDFKAK